MLADSVDDFARSCVELLVDRARARRTSVANAWELIRRRYARSSVIERIRADVDAVLANSTKRGNGTVMNECQRWMAQLGSRAGYTVVPNRPTCRVVLRMSISSACSTGCRSVWC